MARFVAPLGSSPVTLSLKFQGWTAMQIGYSAVFALPALALPPYALQPVRIVHTLDARLILQQVGFSGVWQDLVQIEPVGMVVL